MGLKTKVMAASLTSIDDVMKLAGLHHITVAPALLKELANEDTKSWNGAAVTGKAFREAVSTPPITDSVAHRIVRDEASWRLAFTRSKEGRNEGKNIQAINIFSNFQDELEELVRSHQVN